MKEKLKMVWVHWCKMVEEHNEGLGYGDIEEVWSPFTIFTGIGMSSFFTILLFICLLLVKVELWKIGIVVLLFNLSCNIILNFFLYLNWKMYDFVNRTDK